MLPIFLRLLIVITESQTRLVKYSKKNYKQYLHSRGLFSSSPCWLFFNWFCWWNDCSLYKNIPNNLQAKIFIHE